MSGDIDLGIGDAFEGFFDLASELITDKDKLAEFNLEGMKIQSSIQLALIKQKTVPWVDATVKLMYALNDLIKSNYRPIGGLAMTAFAAYCQIKNISLDPNLKVIFGSAFPAWGVSRHVEKVKKGEKRWWNPFD